MFFIKKSINFVAKMRYKQHLSDIHSQENIRK